ncbi:MAG: hypothetical protein INR62_05350 [Rhodospirillales bacterium]|nr:hypothetical protein [Acetobacter sp.]
MSLKPKFPQFEPYLWWTDRLTWVEDSFVELEAAFLWWFLPDRLQCIARAEMAAGNLPETLQLDRRTFVPLMSFSRPPFAAMPPVDEITVHTAFAPGNYCTTAPHVHMNQMILLASSAFAIRTGLTMPA